MVTSRYWMELTTRDVAKLPPGTIAILPVAAVEQHGPHMPLGTDTLINREIVARCLELLPTDLSVVVLPEQAIGSSGEHAAFPGTLSLAPAAAMQLWDGVLTDVITRTTISKLLLFNSHGGQTRLLQPVALELRRRFEVLVAYASWFDGGYPEGLFSDDELAFGIHAGAIETSMMLHLRPELVDRDYIADFPSQAAAFEQRFHTLQTDPGGGRLGGFGWMMQDLGPSGAAGDATRATAEAGRALVDHAASRLRELLLDMHAFALTDLASRTFLSPD